MGEVTAISWCDHTFNPWIGCQKIAPACDGCYAWAMMEVRYGRVEFGGPGKGVGTRARTSAANWAEPHRWNRKAAEAGTRPFVFGGSLMDPFDKHVDPIWRRDYFGLIRETPNLLYLLLSKRPQLMVELSEDAGGLPPNVALGTTAEDQERWDLNVPELAAAKAVLSPLFAFVSIEPMVGPVNPRRAPISRSMKRHFTWEASGADQWDPIHPRQDPRFRMDWLITGGETDQGGHKARPSHPAWFHAVRDACTETGTAYHHKQNGEWAIASHDNGHFDSSMSRNDAVWLGTDGRTAKPSHIGLPDPIAMFKAGPRRSGRLLDGVVHNARPEVPVA